jgi:hypothetical protein
MRKIKQISFIVLVITFILSSCTVERRLYNSGFHVKWNKSHSASETEVSFNDVKKVDEVVEIFTKNEISEVALNENETFKTEAIDAIDLNENVSLKEKKSLTHDFTVGTISEQKKENNLWKKILSYQSRTTKSKAK